MGQLMPTNMTAYEDLGPQFEFTFIDNGLSQASFKYKSFDNPGIFTSIPSQNLQANVVQGPDSLADIPMREDDAVLMTVENPNAPVTIPMPNFRVRLFLGGVLTWEGDIEFEVPVSTFRLDGTWTQY
jgi:hypothetical protein